jgi:hypothetical protein
MAFETSARGRLFVKDIETYGIVKITDKGLDFIKIKVFYDV